MHVSSISPGDQTQVLPTNGRTTDINAGYDTIEK